MRSLVLRVTLASVVLAIVACSNLSQNSVREGDIVFSGGVYQDQTWKDDIVFKRLSWYRELSLVYDAYFYKVNPKDRAYVWFSQSEKELVKSCESFLIGVLYNLPGSGITHRLFKNEMLSNGYVNYSVPNFVSNLRAHPDFAKWTLQSYKVEGFCLSNKLGGEIDITLPGFKRSRMIP